MNLSTTTILDVAAEIAGLDLGVSGAVSDVDWGAEDAYWRDHYQHRPYVAADLGYEFYQNGYRYGCNASAIYGPRRWDDDVERNLARGWPQARPGVIPMWSQIRDAVRDGYAHACGHAA